MCLIAVAPKGSDKYDAGFIAGLQESAIGNKDGIGFSYKCHRTRKIYYSKGFMDFRGFLAAYKTHSIKPEDEVVVHLRTGNKGKISSHMCHPFQCVANDKELNLPSNSTCGWSNYPLLFHNGTMMDYYLESTPGISDSYNFAKIFMAQHEIQDFLIRDSELFENLFEPVLSTNKLAIMFPNIDTETKLIGKFIEKDGYMYSNKSFEPYIYDVGGSSFNKKGRKYLYANNRIDDWDDEYENYPSSYKQIASVIPITNPIVLHKPASELVELDVELIEARLQTNKEISSIINLTVTDYNYSDLILIGKTDNHGIIKGRSYVIDNWVFIGYNPKQTLTSNNGVVISYAYCTASEIFNYFIVSPKPEFTERYKDLILLKNTVGIPSKNFMKKLKVLLIEKLFRMRNVNKLKIPAQFVKNKSLEIDKYAVAYFFLANESSMYTNKDFNYGLSDRMAIYKSLELSDKCQLKKVAETKLVIDELPFTC